MSLFEACGMCKAKGIPGLCAHDPGKMTAQCWGQVEDKGVAAGSAAYKYGLHSGTCPSWCECECHTGTYPHQDKEEGICRVCNRDGLSCTTSGMECICSCHAPTDDEVREAIESIKQSVRGV